MDYRGKVQSAQIISLNLLEENKGQYLGLPANPRGIREEKFELLKKNIQEHPEFLAYNALKVLPMDDGKYIIIGGNMRFRAMKELGMSEAPCIVIDKDTPIEDLKAYVVLDNSPFGQWDWQMLQSEDWDVDQLEGWGVEMPNWETGGEDINPDDYSDQFSLPDGDKDGCERVAFILSSEQADFIKSKLREANAGKYDNFGNTNSNGNSLYAIVKEWADVKK